AIASVPRLTAADGPRATVVDSSRLRRTLPVDRCPDGCWLILGAGDHPAGGPGATVFDSSRLRRTLTVDRCPDGCWLILGEGYHPSWAAATAAGSLGPSQVVA